MCTSGTSTRSLSYQQCSRDWLRMAAAQALTYACSVFQITRPLACGRPCAKRSLELRGRYPCCSLHQEICAKGSPVCMTIHGPILSTGTAARSSRQSNMLEQACWVVQRRAQSITQFAFTCLTGRQAASAENLGLRRWFLACTSRRRLKRRHAPPATTSLNVFALAVVMELKGLARRQVRVATASSDETFRVRSCALGGRNSGHAVTEVK